MNIEVIIHVYFLVTMCCNLIEQEKKTSANEVNIISQALLSTRRAHFFFFRFARLKFE